MMMRDGLAEASRLMAEGQGGTKFKPMAIGTGNTPAAGTQVQLVSEITTGGGARKSGGDVTCTLETTNVAGDTIRFVTTWAFTNPFSIWEFNVTNSPTVNDGDQLLRQVFDSAYNAIPGDTLTLEVDVISSDEVVAAESVLTNAGLAEGNRLMGEGLTPVSGRWKDIALGRDDGTLLALSPTNTALGDEIVAADGLGLSKSEGTALAVRIVTTNVPDDTIEIEKSWTSTGTVSVNEVCMSTSNTEEQGIMPMRYIFPAPLNFIPTDKFTHIMRQIQVS